MRTIRILGGVVVLTAAVAFANDTSRNGDPDACKRAITRQVDAGIAGVALTPHACDNLDEDEVEAITDEVTDDALDDARRDVLDNLRNWPAMTP